jgi:hypothetical protein
LAGKLKLKLSLAGKLKLKLSLAGKLKLKLIFFLLVCALSCS